MKVSLYLASDAFENVHTNTQMAFKLSYHKITSKEPKQNKTHTQTTTKAVFVQGSEMMFQRSISALCLS